LSSVTCLNPAGNSNKVGSSGASKVRSLLFWKMGVGHFKRIADFRNTSVMYLDLSILPSTPEPLTRTNASARLFRNLGGHPLACSNRYTSHRACSLGLVRWLQDPAHASLFDNMPGGIPEHNLSLASIDVLDVYGKRCP